MNTLLPPFSDFIPVMRKFSIECHLCCISSSCRCIGGGHTHVQGRTASGDSSGGENTSLPGLRSSGPPVFRSNSVVCKFPAADHGVNAPVVPPRGFSVAASFCVFQRRVQEGTAAPASATFQTLLPSLF